MAENKVISIEDGWNIEDERSISFAPQLSLSLIHISEPTRRS